MSDHATGWPFWAPSDLAEVERALDLAGLRPGEGLIDLGCGDGQVLVAAARRGATVRGIECDAALAELARKALAVNGLEGEVIVGDLFDPDLDLAAEVIFTYLAPATLQRLVPRLQQLDGNRLVTVDFAVPGTVADGHEGQCHRYTLPAAPRDPEQPQWHSAGTLVVTVPDVSSLTCLDLHHPGGDVTLTASPALAGVATLLTGADRADPGGAVAVDVRWVGCPAGSLAAGWLRVPGLPDHHLTVLFSDAEQESQWELSDEGAAGVARRLRRTDLPRPTTSDDLLAAAHGT